MEKTKKLQLEDFTENGFYGTQEQQYLKAQVREELKEQGFIIDSSFEGDFKTWIGVYARRFCCKVLILSIKVSI